ncbi:hypothetical protein SSX86_033195 [Deinandra increscens subsp. villosa]|uniref:Uncharacterized protein n=1 Tax=Deinandra increscens subsp. villosa TaxID=3103831 RepID=A0AAP0C6Q0_9ASTR
MLRYSSGGDFATAKRKYDDSTTAPPPSTARRQTGFSAPIIPSHSSDSASAYNSVPPPVDEIAARIFNSAEAKRPKFENGGGYDSNDGKGFSSAPTGRQAGTPLHHAARSGLGEMVNLLLSHGANALTLNDDCQTALDVARVKGYSNIVRAIEVDAHSNLGNLMKAQGSVQQVILVGHSAGGLSVTQATHKFPNKISLVIYVAATMLKNGFLTEQDTKDMDEAG